MANAEVYVKWSDQTDGNRGSGAWALMSDGVASHQKQIIALDMHAERVAWADAWTDPTKIRAAALKHKNHPDAIFEIKFWVDQQICPTCQRWMVVEVLSNLKGMKHILGLEDLRWKAYAEVEHSIAWRNEKGKLDSAKQVARVRIGRETEWPETVGGMPDWQSLRAID